LTTTTDDQAGSQAGPKASALAEFVHRLCAEERPPLERYVRSLVSADAHRAEDVVQETLLRAWLNRHRLIRDRIPPRPWLFTVARNIAIDWHRRDMARPQQTHDGMLAKLPDTEDHIERLLDRTTVTDAISALADQHREVLYYQHYCGRTGPETAELVGVPRGTVKSRTHSAVQSLRRALADRGLQAA
jgi:RNA polymerase sigma-70 factor (ECF subfamily)